MFVDDVLKDHLETSSSVKNRSFIAAEWNMNVPDNILMVGNYRYRKTGTLFNYLSMQFDPNDKAHDKGTNSDVVIDNGFDNDNEPIAFTSDIQKEKLYYSLDDCLGRFRPRSGINKARFFSNSGNHFFNGLTTIESKSYLDTNRPRYYAADRADNFKYWTSLRTEGGNTYGISDKSTTGISEYLIDDVAPFVVYKEPVPTNRVVVKMQTNVGTVDQGTISYANGTSIPDPLYGKANQTTPVKWKIQGLVGENWETLQSFTSSSLRRNGKDIIGPDGYVELSYGLIVPDQYRDIFIHAETYSTAALLPVKAVNGYAYLIKSSATDIGTYHIWIDANEEYETFTPTYSWEVAEETVDRFTHFVTDTTSPDSFTDTTNQFRQTYRELQHLRGIRIVVETMNKLESTFDLIEMSARLAVNITDKTKSVSVKKSASDLGISGLPVGQLVVSTGSIEIFDFDNSFNKSNTASIIANYAPNQIQFKIYDVIAEVLDGGIYYDYYVPIKTMYGDGFPEMSAESRSVNISLRDMFSYFESTTAPQVLVRSASLSYAVSFLLDNIGFSNYVFKKLPGESEPIIPFFYVEPDVTVAEVLNELARSTQTAMFFDEYNNFVMMSKGYMLPATSERATDITLYGSKDFAKSGVERNTKTKSKLANIIGIASQDTEIYNDGKINYTTRYIEKSYSALEQANKLDRDKSWTYKPSLLWEVSPSEATKSQNGDGDGALSTYALTAIPLKSPLTASEPTVDSKGVIINNVMDFGDGAQWMGRYAGYFYANGEIIRYDAVQYRAGGEVDPVWISSLEEYQYYFSKMPFNGKMFPTGLVRIYSKPFYSKQTGLPLTGAVEKHGRAQFGTTKTQHKAGLVDADWTATLSGVTMDADYLFSAVGNFQLKDGYVPYKANIPVKVGGTGSTAWTISGPGTLSKTSGTANDTVETKDIRKTKEYTYSLTVDGIKKYSVTEPLERKKNVDGATLFGDIEVIGVASANSTTSNVTLRVTFPSFRSFFENATKAKTGAKTTYDWSIVGPTVTGGGTGKISAPYDPNKIVNKVKGFYDSTRTAITQGSTHLFPPARLGTASANPQYDFTVQVKKDQPNTIALVIGTTVIKTIMINPGSVFGYLGSKTNVTESYDQRTIMVEDTSAIKVGQKVTLYTESQSLSASGTSTVSKNEFEEVNELELRVSSIESDRRFKVKRKGDATSSKPLSYNAKTLGTDMETLTFVDQRFLTENADAVAGAKTNEAGNRDSKKLAQGASITGVIKNFLAADTSLSNAGTASTQTVPDGSVQSSALVMSGPAFTDANDPESVDFVSYTYKDLGSDAAKYKYFGTRLRIIGKQEYSGSQSGVGEETWYTNKQLSQSGTETKTSVKASSGGLAVLLNPKTNNGYYFEIAALSDTATARRVGKYSAEGKEIEEPVHNLLFYKMNVGLDEEGTLLTNQKATPVKLWGGLTNVMTDNGLFVGQSRMTSNSSTNSVYDLGVEYEVVNGTSLKFYLYVNNVLVGTVTDKEPFLDATKKPIIYNNMAMFVRGKAKCMFEHVFAISTNPSQTGTSEVLSSSTANISGVFGDGSISFSESMRKYAISGIVNDTYLSNVSTSGTTKTSVYYEEFGTIMREAAYFNVRYDKSYPALIAKIAPTYNNNRGYTVSGFLPGPYSAEFLIFNSTDSVLVLDGSDGNYLRIHGVTFTQQSTHELTVDEHFSMRSSLSDPQGPPGSSLVKSPLKEAQEYNRIRNSRSAYGKKEFVLESRYIQSQDAAGSMMEWLVGKIMKPRKSVGVKVFSLPTLQLGDIVSIDMKDENGIDQVAPEASRFVVYQIDYSKSSDGPSMSVYLSEVV